ncbi:hypothetical protein CPT03_16590 [Pedobacter ginsengisoli]|uniref:Polysaccharide biosynthesis protein C-terminal domain-containing protein n=1 Tax=Pedobacter ginsengisoli TaxID=363852 RepID=A0A2D1U8U5_9SPHI|nr:oligosaccharide flippase family protein [Pedobacter ginsengisoli]ATP57964.1 hypothetical protein CPT03_16590 [Pedobacter ginsengisoli]
MTNITKEIKRGAFWVLLFSFIGGPIAILRNWLFTYYDPTGSYVADFALTMILFNLITSFFVFGGSSVLTNLVPKIDLKKDRFSFLTFYSAVCMLLLLICILVLLLFPQSIEYLTNNKIKSSQNIYVLLMSVPVIVAQILVYFLQGEADYKSASFITQLPNFLNTGIILLLIFLKIPILNLKYQDSLIMFLSSIIILSSVLMIIIGTFKIRRHFNSNSVGFFIPRGFWSFSLFIHLMTIITFLYQNIDQIFVLKILNVKELGRYFIIIQLVETVRFIPLKIGQVLLASFSKIIHQGDEKLLIQTYNKVGRIIIVINLVISVILMCFSSYILNTFHIKGRIYDLSFCVLLIGYNIACIGNINSMILLAKNLSKSFFLNSCLVIITLMGSVYLLSTYKLIGIVIGKSISIFIGQVGLFYLINKYINNKIGINRDYLFSQAILVVIAVCIFTVADINLLFRLIILMSSLIIVFKYYKFSFGELRSLIKSK